jgi:hypothetical protein
MQDLSYSGPLRRSKWTLCCDAVISQVPSGQIGGSSVDLLALMLSLVSLSGGKDT